MTSYYSPRVGGALQQQIGPASPGLAGQAFGFGPAVSGRPAAQPAAAPDDTGGFGFGMLLDGGQLLPALGFGRALGQLGDIPVVGGVARAVVEEVASPITLAAAVPGARQISRFVQPGRALPVRAAGRVLESVSPYGTYQQRVAAESLIGLGARTSAEQLDLPGPLQYTEPFIGGVAGLLALRRGQARLPQVFGPARKDVPKELRILDPENAETNVADHMQTIAGIADPSPVNRAAAKAVTSIPFLHNIFGDFITNPAVHGMRERSAATYRGLSNKWNNELRIVNAGLTEPGGLFSYNRGSTNGMIKLDDLHIEYEDDGDTIKSILFKDGRYNNDASKIEKFFNKFGTEFEERQGIDHRQILGDDSEVAPALSAKNLRANYNGEIPVGEVLERHRKYRTYFPRISQLDPSARASDQHGTGRIKSRYRLDRSNLNLPSGYRTMIEVAEELGLTLDDQYYLDPELLIQARIQGGLRDAHVRNLQSEFAQIGVSGRDVLEAMDDSPLKAARQKLKDANKEYKAALKKVERLRGAKREVSKDATALRQFARQVSRWIETKGKGFERVVDGDDRRLLIEAYEGLRDLRKSATAFGNMRQQIGELKGIQDTLRKESANQRRSFKVQMNLLAKQLPELEQQLADLETSTDYLAREVPDELLTSYFMGARNAEAQASEWARFTDRYRNEYMDVLARNESVQAKYQQIEDTLQKTGEEITSLKGSGRDDRPHTLLFNQIEDMAERIRGVSNFSAYMELLRLSSVFGMKVEGPIEKRLLDLRANFDVAKESVAPAGQRVEEAKLEIARLLSSSQSKLLNNVEDPRFNLVGDVQKLFPLLAGKTFTAEQARAIEDIVRAEFLPTDIQRKILKSQSFLRSAIATFDLSWFMIQGWALAFSKPTVFAEVFSTVMKSLKDPEVYTNYMRSNQGVVTEAVSNNLKILDDYLRDEVVGGSPLATTIDALANRVGGASAVNKAKILSNIARKSDQAFIQAGNVARIELYKGLKTHYGNIAALKKSVISEKDLKEIADAANQLTGVTDDVVFNVERFGLFAPRYTRAMFKNIFDTAGVSENTMKAQIVRQSMLTAIGVSALMVIFVNEFITGEETDFKPIKNGRYNGNFMTIKGFFGRDVNPFGPYKTQMRFFVDAFARDPGTATVRFARNKAAPLAGIVADIAEGHSPGGTPIEINTLEGFTDTALTYALERVTPIALNDIRRSIEEGGVEEVINPNTLLQIMGMAAYDRRSYSLKESLAQRRFNKPYSELTGQERDALRRENPEMFQLAQRELQRRAKYDPKAQAFLRMDEIDQERVLKEGQLNDRLNTGDITSKQFRDGMNAIALEAQTKKSMLRGDLGEPADDDVLSQYYSTFRQAEIAPGIIDWDLQQQLEGKLRASLSADELRKIDERSEVEHHPSVDWFYENKKIIQKSDYWDTLDKAFDGRAGSRARALGIGSYQDLLRALRRARSLQDANASERIQELVDEIARASDKMRIMLRRGNPSLDAALVQSGYVTVPISRRVR